MRIEVVTVPYRYDQHLDGSGRGAQVLIDEGLLDKLAGAGIDVSGVRESALGDDERVERSIAVNIGRLGAHTASHVAAALTARDGVLVLAGDDTAMVGVVSGVQQALGAGVRLGLVWLDAHGDFNTPDTSYSGILAGMPVAILAGLAGPLWRGAAGLAAPIPTDRIVLAGVRMLDERENTLLQSTDVGVISTRDAIAGTIYRHAIERLADACDVLCVHVDLDVLDPSLVPSSATPESNGLTVAQAASLVRDALATHKVRVVSVAGLNPGGGKLGRVSVSSATAVILESIPAWTTPEPDANADA
jgi:arginase